MSINYLFVKYRTKIKNPDKGEIKGQVIEITPPRKGEENRGSKEGSWLGFTKMRVDMRIWDLLMTGVKTVDVKKSTSKKMVISATPDLYRIEASKYVSLSKEEWNKSIYYQPPAIEDVYSEYVDVFLTEFTKLTRHIPANQLIKYYPHAWVFPSQTNVFVGRDGLAIAYSYPDRPDISNITIDTSKIVDNLLLPHLKNKRYLSCGPNRISKTICDDQCYVRMVGKGSFYQRSELGNPDFVITEKKYHGFWENMGMFRGYGDGKHTEKLFGFVEFFGDIAEQNYTKEKAENRARIYAEKWITNKFTDGKIDSSLKLRSAINELKSLIIRDGVGELEIEKFLDQHPWILERGLGYKSYHSQVTVDKGLISRS